MNDVYHVCIEYLESRSAGKWATTTIEGPHIWRREMQCKIALLLLSSAIMHAIMCCDAVDDGQVMHDPTKPINVIAKASNISHRQCVMLYI